MAGESKVSLPKRPSRRADFEKACNSAGFLSFSVLESEKVL
ncbi:hypothetical protein [Paenibacillus ferrarius]|nr:hypothetical protein [Paenibacillus ferrarius]